MSVAIFSPTPYINKWQMSLCNNSLDNKSYWIHRVDVKVSAQVTTVTYMHQSQPSLHSPRKHLTVHLQLWPGNHLIWCNATWRNSATTLSLWGRASSTMYTGRLLRGWLSKCATTMGLRMSVWLAVLVQSSDPICIHMKHAAILLLIPHHLEGRKCFI